jgi:hypothetical protein
MPILYGYLIFFEIHIPWQYRYWGENTKTHIGWYQYVQSLQFSHNGMNIMVLKCVVLQGYIISMWICWFSLWCHKKCNFLHKLKGKNLWWTFFLKPTKHWSQQNSFANVPKSSQMYHWWKVKVVKLELYILLIY